MAEFRAMLALFVAVEFQFVDALSPGDMMVRTKSLLNGNDDRASAFCVNIVTGSGENAGGYAKVLINGDEKVPQTKFAKGATVLDNACYDNSVQSITLTNSNTDAWMGTMELKIHGVVTDVFCAENCDGKVQHDIASNTAIAVDGNADATGTPVTCLSGKECVFKPMTLATSCVKIVTGSGDHAGGYVKVLINGDEKVSQTKFAKGATVLDMCYDYLVQSITLTNSNTNAWMGKMELKIHGVVNNVFCAENCDATDQHDIASNTEIAVDGNADAKGTPVICLSGKECVFKPVTPSPTASPSMSPTISPTASPTASPTMSRRLTTIYTTVPGPGSW